MVSLSKSLIAQLVCTTTAILFVVFPSVSAVHAWGGAKLAIKQCAGTNSKNGDIRCVGASYRAENHQADFMQLSNVSYTVCNGAWSIEQFVSAGTQCARTYTGDSIIAGVVPDDQIIIYDEEFNAPPASTRSTTAPTPPSSIYTTKSTLPLISSTIVPTSAPFANSTKRVSVIPISNSSLETNTSATKS